MPAVGPDVVEIDKQIGDSHRSCIERTIDQAKFVKANSKDYLLRLFALIMVWQAGFTKP